ncbi:MAG TPA: hypothetical protein VFZ48_04490 [Candidatus Saccharimonadales bacterium]
MEQAKTLLANYQPSAEAIALLKEVPTLLLVGISGAGKDTVKALLMKTGRYHHVVSHTTRAMRNNDGVSEQNGVEYHFTDMPTIITMLKNHGFIEAKQYGSNIYGTSVGEFRLAKDEGKIAVSDVEVKGVAELVALSPESVRPVFLLPPSFAVWESRWRQRYGNDHVYHTQDYRERVEAAIFELKHVLQKPYYHLVINDELAATVRVVDEIAQSGGPTNHSEHTGHIERLLSDMRRSLDKI